MSTTRETPTGTDPSARRPVSPKALAGLAAAAVAGVAVYLVGLPADVSVGGTSLADLTLPAALLVTLVLGCAVGVAQARAPWRVVDIVVASVLGVAGGLVFAVWNIGWNAFSGLVPPPASALFVGVWLLPGVLGGLVIRKPGAAVYVELVAATVSALIGNQWGFATVWYGLLQGFGAELVLALVLYRSFRLPVALAAGASAGVVVGLLDSVLYYPLLPDGLKAAYVALAVVSGVVIAGGGSYALTRGLARTGALAPLRSGRDVERV